MANALLAVSGLNPSSREWRKIQGENGGALDSCSQGSVECPAGATRASISRVVPTPIPNDHWLLLLSMSFSSLGLIEHSSFWWCWLESWIFCFFSVKLCEKMDMPFPFRSRYSYGKFLGHFDPYPLQEHKILEKFNMQWNRDANFFSCAYSGVYLWNGPWLLLSVDCGAVS